jgi:hypothetical protein
MPVLVKAGMVLYIFTAASSVPREAPTAVMAVPAEM